MDVSTEIANFVVNLDPLSQEGFEISWVHDTIFNGVGAIDREFQVDLLLLETLALDGLAFNDNFGCLFLVFDGSLQRSSLLGSSLGSWSRFLGSGSSSWGSLHWSSFSGGSLSGGSLSRGSLSGSSFGRSSF